MSWLKYGDSSTIWVNQPTGNKRENWTQISDILSSSTLKPDPNQNPTLVNIHFVLFYAQFVKYIQDYSYETCYYTLVNYQQLGFFLGWSFNEYV